MLRVLHITNTMGRGGIETFIMNVYRNIDREKVQFDFLLSSEKEDYYCDEIRKLGGKIYKWTPRRKGINKSRRDLINFFESHKEYDIVHQHVSSLTNIDPLKIAKKFNVPVRIVHSHNTKQGGSSIHKYIHYFNKLFIENIATEYYACSHLAAQWLFPSRVILNNKYDVINNGVDISKFNYDEQVRNKTRSLFKLEDKLVIGHIGRFAHQKNHKFLIEIFNEVHQKHKNSILMLVGEGGLKEQIIEQLNQYNLIDHTIFTGARSDIPQLLNAMDIFVMPSHHEGLPVTIVEAQAASLPCVLSKNITKEVQFTNNVHWCDLNEEAKKWASMIIEISKKNNREKSYLDPRNLEFDIVKVANKLESGYIDLIKNEVRND